MTFDIDDWCGIWHLTFVIWHWYVLTWYSSMILTQSQFIFTDGFWGYLSRLTQEEDLRGKLLKRSVVGCNLQFAICIFQFVICNLQQIPWGAPPCLLFSRHAASVRNIFCVAVRNIFWEPWEIFFESLGNIQSSSAVLGSISHLWTEFVSPLQHSWLQRVVVGSANLTKMYFFPLYWSTFFNIKILYLCGLLQDRRTYFFKKYTACLQSVVLVTFF